MEHYIEFNDEGTILYNTQVVERVKAVDEKTYSHNHGKITYTVKAPANWIWVYTNTNQAMSKDKQLVMELAYENALGPRFIWGN